MTRLHGLSVFGTLLCSPRTSTSSCFMKQSSHPPAALSYLTNAWAFPRPQELPRVWQQCCLFLSSRQAHCCGPFSGPRPLRCGRRGRSSRVWSPSFSSNPELYSSLARSHAPRARQHCPSHSCYESPPGHQGSLAPTLRRMPVISLAPCPN